MNGSKRDELAPVIAALATRRLDGAARLALEVLAPLDVLTSQLVVFTRPLLPLARWRALVQPLEEPAAWPVLRTMLDEER